MLAHLCFCALHMMLAHLHSALYHLPTIPLQPRTSCLEPASFECGSPVRSSPSSCSPANISLSSCTAQAGAHPYFFMNAVPLHVLFHPVFDNLCWLSLPHQFFFACTIHRMPMHHLQTTHGLAAALGSAWVYKQLWPGQSSAPMHGDCSTGPLGSRGHQQVGKRRE